jgi:hypothetical protein
VLYFWVLVFFHFVCMIVQTRSLINQFLFALRKYVLTKEIVITIKVKMEGLPSAEHQLLPAGEHISRILARELAGRSPLSLRHLLT